MATMDVKDGAGSLTTIEKPNANGRAAATASRPVALSNEDFAAISVTAATSADLGAGDYETVAASQTDQAMGATGAAGDYLAGVLIVPATTSPGAVSIKDGSGSGITIFAGGASSVASLAPIMAPLGVKSKNGAWKITTGANVTAIGIGNFT